MPPVPEPPPYEPPAHGFRTFLILWATQSVSVFGSALTFFAITIWLTQVRYPAEAQKAELAFALSANSLAFALPTVFGAPLAGAWADRHDRKRTMVAADVASGVLALLLAALMAGGALDLWLLVPLTAGFALLGAFHSSAFFSSYAMLVPHAQLPRANGMMFSTEALSGILSPALAAGLIALPALARQGALPDPLAAALAPLADGAPFAIGLDALTFFLASLVLLALRVPSPRRTDLAPAADGSSPRKSFWADVAEGGVYIWRRRPLLWLLGTFTVANFVGSPLQVFQPLLVRFNLAGDWAARGLSFEGALALLASAGGLGGVAGGAFVSAWGGLKARRIYGVLVPMILSGLAQVAFGLSGLVYLTAALAFVVAAMVPILNAHSQAIWQAQVPPELQGRVFAVRRVIAQFTWPVSTALAGLAGGLFNPGVVVAALGALLATFCLAQLFNPHLRRVEDRAWLERLAAEAGDEVPPKRPVEAPLRS